METERDRANVGRVSEDSATYLKFQPVLPDFLFRRIFPLSQPTRVPPRCVSCVGRLLLLLLQEKDRKKELVYSTRRARIVYGPLPFFPPSPPSLPHQFFRTRNRRSCSLLLFLSRLLLSYTTATIAYNQYSLPYSYT